jgi:hypothetical protein
MDPHSKKLKDIALENIFQINKLIEIHKKALALGEPKPLPLQKPHPQPKPQDYFNFYTIKEVD